METFCFSSEERTSRMPGDGRTRHSNNSGAFGRVNPPEAGEPWMSFNESGTVPKGNFVQSPWNHEIHRSSMMDPCEYLDSTLRPRWAERCFMFFSPMRVGSVSADRSDRRGCWSLVPKRTSSWAQHIVCSFSRGRVKIETSREALQRTDTSPCRLYSHQKAGTRALLWG